MKKIIKTMMLVVLSLSLVACGSREQKAFEESLNKAISKLMAADTISVSVDATFSARSTQGIQVNYDFKAKDIQTQLVAEGVVTGIIGNSDVKISEMYIVDDTIYTYDIQTERKTMEYLGLSLLSFNPTGIESKAIVSVLNVKGVERSSDGSKTFKLMLDGKGIKNILKLTNDIASLETDMDEVLLVLEQIKDMEFFITFDAEGNFKKLSIDLSDEGTDIGIELNIVDIDGKVDIKIPSLDEYIENNY